MKTSKARPPEAPRHFHDLEDGEIEGCCEVSYLVYSRACADRTAQWHLEELFKSLVNAPETKGRQFLELYMCHEPSRGSISMRARFGRGLAKYVSKRPTALVPKTNSDGDAR